MLFLGALLGLASSGMSAAFTAREAQKQRDFQLMMSNTAYRRGMRDMKKAGLNPILAYKQGGASTPQGAMGGTVDFTKGVSTALAATRQVQELRNMEMAENKDESQMNLNNQNAWLARASEHTQRQTALNTIANTAKTVKQTSILSPDQSRALFNDALNRGPMGPTIMGLERGLPTAAKAIGALAAGKFALGGRNPFKRGRR